MTKADMDQKIREAHGLPLTGDIVGIEGKRIDFLAGMRAAAETVNPYYSGATLIIRLNADELEMK